MLYHKVVSSVLLNYIMSPDDKYSDKSQFTIQHIVSLLLLSYESEKNCGILEVKDENLYYLFSFEICSVA